MESVDIDLGDSYIDCRLSDKSKKIYKSKIVHFTKWIQFTYPIYFDASTGKVKLQDLTPDVLKTFLAAASLKRNKKAETAENPFVYLVPHKKQSFEHVIQKCYRK